MRSLDSRERVGETRAHSPPEGGPLGTRSFALVVLVLSGMLGLAGQAMALQSDHLACMKVKDSGGEGQRVARRTCPAAYTGAIKVSPMGPVSRLWREPP